MIINTSKSTNETTNETTVTVGMDTRRIFTEEFREWLKTALLVAVVADIGAEMCVSGGRVVDYATEQVMARLNSLVTAASLEIAADPDRVNRMISEINE